MTGWAGSDFAWLSAHDAQMIAATIGAICATVLAVAAVYRLPAVNRPLRWLGRTLIADPLTRLIHTALDGWASNPDGPIAAVGQRLAAVEAQLQPNGGSSLRDRVDATAQAVGAKADPKAGSKVA